MYIQEKIEYSCVHDMLLQLRYTQQLLPLSAPFSHIPTHNKVTIAVIEYTLYTTNVPRWFRHRKNNTLI